MELKNSLPENIKSMYNYEAYNQNITKFNPIVITPNNIDLILETMPVLKRIKHNDEEKESVTGLVRKYNDQKDITRGYLNTKSISELKKIAKSMGLYKLRGGKDVIIQKILDQKKILIDYHTI